ncbi:MAG: T9SS type A sorting domain-containing protein [Candidatus Electryonea clarkiae]|nr:T9SS type A sorting domain-containing protein [Candidatus Electryonea clarkiae]MDP8285246.1 T9SS type A sorting domain-containing protein [Candidatus Electryonea clarkiae]
MLLKRHLIVFILIASLFTGSSFAQLFDSEDYDGYTEERDPVAAGVALVNAGNHYDYVILLDGSAANDDKILLKKGYGNGTFYSDTYYSFTNLGIPKDGKFSSSGGCYAVASSTNISLWVANYGLVTPDTDHKNSQDGQIIDWGFFNDGSNEDVIVADGSDIDIYHLNADFDIPTTPSRSTTVASNVQVLATAKLDGPNDDNTDFVVTFDDNGDTRCRAYRVTNNSITNQGSFLLPDSLGDIGGIALADLDYDEYPDLVLSTRAGDVIVFYNEGSGNGYFSTSHDDDYSFESGVIGYIISMGIHDLDKDGYGDLALAGEEIMVVAEGASRANGFDIDGNGDLIPWYTSDEMTVYTSTQSVDINFVDLYEDGGFCALVTRSMSSPIGSDEFWEYYYFLEDDDIKPAIPLNIGLTINGSSHPVISWDEVKEPDIDVYRIYRQYPSVSRTWYYIGYVNSSTFQYTDTGFGYSAGGNYVYYKVKARDVTPYLYSNYSKTVTTRGYMAAKAAPQQEQPDLPDVISMGNAYPNPFNPTTTMQIGIPEASRVTIIVYDIMGREVTSLINKDYEAGLHEIVFDAGNLPSGSYIVRMESGSFSATQRVMLLK